jgi:urease subunit gamma/beta
MRHRCFFFTKFIVEKRKVFYAYIMHLAPHDLDRLILHQAGFLAQKRLARGLLLNYPEAVSLIACQLLEFIRDGISVAALMNLGRTFLGHREVMQGVPEMIDEVQVEGTFADGSKLVTVHHPIELEHGNLALALHGSFLPVPTQEMFEKNRINIEKYENDEIQMSGILIGITKPKEGHILLNEGRESIELEVIHTGDRPIQVGSHFPFEQTNRALHFEREKTHEMRLDIPAGTAIRFEPGEKKTVRLVKKADKSAIRGHESVFGPISIAAPSSKDKGAL